MHRTFCLAAAAGLVMAAASAQAQDGPPSNYREYWETIVAFNHCVDQDKDQDLSLEQYETLDDTIVRDRLNQNIGAAAKLRAIENARTNINQNWASKGCSNYGDPRFGIVRDRFDQFASDLAPVIGLSPQVQSTP